MNRLSVPMALSSEPSSVNEGDQMLADAIREESTRASRKGQEDPFAGFGIKFKEVSSTTTQSTPQVSAAVVLMSERIHSFCNKLLHNI